MSEWLSVGIAGLVVLMMLLAVVVLAIGIFMNAGERK